MDRNQLAAEMTHYAPQPILGPRGQQMRNYLADVVSGENLRQGLQNYRNAFLQMSQAGLTGQPLTPEAEAAMMDIFPGGGLAGITAFHGSPHLFEKFSLGKIGTGEGAQAYGHGLYFSENPRVAGDYQRRLSYQHNAKANREISDEFYKHYPDGLAFVNYRAYRSPQELLDSYHYGNFGRGAEGLPEGMADAMDKASGGSFYKVDIPDKYVNNFLDWDKPLSEQSKQVQDFAINDLGYTKEQLKTAKGSDALSILQMRYREAGANAPEMMASKELKSLGIKGIRYLDQGSRQAGKGSSNFVVFDEDIIQMLERNNEPVRNVLRSGTIKKIQPKTKNELAGADIGYRGGHTAPIDPEYHAPLHDMTQTYPADIYSPQAMRYYGHGDPSLDRESFEIINKTRGKPDEKIKMYRAVPIDAPDEILPGDWVTINKKYARQHGQGLGKYKILQAEVKAKQLRTDGNSPHEFGYTGETEQQLKILRPQAGFSPEMESEIAQEARNKLAAGHIPVMFKKQAE